MNEGDGSSFTGHEKGVLPNPEEINSIWQSRLRIVLSQNDARTAARKAEEGRGATHP